MAERLGSLIVTMKKLLHAHERVVLLAKQQRDALIEGDDIRLQTVVDKLHTEAKQIDALEQQRADEVAAIAETYHLSDCEQTVKGLSQCIEGVKSKELLNVAEALKVKLKELDELNVQNAELTKQSLVYSTQMMKWIADSTSSSTYNKKSQSEGNANTSPRFISVQI